MKKFSFPKNMVRADVFNRFFGSFYRCGFAAFRIFRGGISSPPVAAKCVRTILSIPHQSGKVKSSRCVPRRSATKSYGFLGSKRNWRFSVGKENFFTY
ncbi:MAG: hypothetical protein A2913_00705 [Parcubacteria group bacterium RIFCSPLOWO2_01_FULL_40_65]|nr:MAG: hypothetical protein A2913_00705 [Parcubacteria group bacterium RIFCSPLOWO2_01_FULL_40_65]